MRARDRQVFEKLRREYRSAALLEHAIPRAPFALFERWFHEAVAAGIDEPNAMTLATVGPRGQPSARIVLMKGITRRGVVFYSHYTSKKGKELSQNDHVALVFHWKELDRQVRIEGRAAKVSRAVTTRYFAGRPRGSQIGSVISPQSRPVPDRQYLEDQFATLVELYKETPVPCPKSWGGYVVSIDRIEFWQGRENRIHDRIEYHKRSGRWHQRRLGP